MVEAASAARRLVLFTKFMIEEIVEKTGYGETYLSKIKQGYQPITPRFRRAMAAGLRRPEEELFAVVEETT